MQARRQAYNNYNPLGHFDEVSDDEDLEIHNNHRKKRDEDSKWKKKLLRKENPIVLDREAIERVIYFIDKKSAVSTSEIYV